MDNRPHIIIKLEALQRLTMVNTLSSILPLYIVTEYPKSGGSWLCSMLAEYMGIPFPRNRRPNITSSIMHGHMSYSPLMKNVTCLYRDGRDVMVSLYYHMLFENDKNSSIVVARTRSDLDFSNFDDIRSNLSGFIEYVHSNEYKSLSPFKFTWGEFVRQWIDKDVQMVRYESLIEDCYGTMKSLLENLINSPIDEERLNAIIKKYSFENQTKRKPGQEDIKSFIRKGQPGDWKEKFTKKSAEVFSNYYGQEMIRLGYVVDNQWIDELKD
ncbi:MAG: sulfotransferase domain-containing protein [Gammaproteobacteria bacterium]|nr:sulfotransferase domain-containing protein [Gammaproteobacteria bacterium]